MKQLPEDIQQFFHKREIIRDYGRVDAWTSACSKKHTEIADFKVDEVVLNNWRIYGVHAHEPGRAYSRFLEGLREAKIYGTKCGTCRRILIPPRSFCEWCFTDVDEWVEHSGEGVVSTYSVSYIGTDPNIRYERPIIVAVIWFKDTHRKLPSSKTTIHAGGILHVIDEVDPRDVRIGMTVVPVWKKAEERKGSILDIKYFKPAGEKS